MPGFAHLHTASGFSLRYGASHPEPLAERAAERGMDALALTDRDTLAGAVRFAKACAGAGVRPLFGVELAVAEPAGGGARGTRAAAPRCAAAPSSTSPHRGSSSSPGTGAAGWAELCRMVTAAHAGGR